MAGLPVKKTTMLITSGLTIYHPQKIQINVNKGLQVDRIF